MSSKKLDTAHLAGEIDKILDEDGISPEELADKSGVAKTTVYGILGKARPTTQRAVGRKIAKGTGREFTIDGTKIYFTKPHEPMPEQLEEAANEGPSVEELLSERITRSLKAYDDRVLEAILKFSDLDEVTQKIISLTAKIAVLEQKEREKESGEGKS